MSVRNKRMKKQHPIRFCTPVSRPHWKNIAPSAMAEKSVAIKCGNQKRVTSGIFAQTREELLNLNLHRCGTFLRQGTVLYHELSSVSLFFVSVIAVAIFLGFIRRRFNDDISIVLSLSMKMLKPQKPCTRAMSFLWTI